MPKQIPERRIATLERKVQALAEDYAGQVYGHAAYQPAVAAAIEGLTHEAIHAKGERTRA